MFKTLRKCTHTSKTKIFYLVWHYYYCCMLAVVAGIVVVGIDENDCTT